MVRTKNNNIQFTNGEKTTIIFKKSNNLVISQKRLRSISKRAFSNMRLEGQDIGEKETLKLAESVIEGMGYSIEK